VKIIILIDSALQKKITPKYARCKIPNTSPDSTHTRRKTQIKRVKDEIKFLYIKKPKLNNELYKTHLQVANEWGNIWSIITKNIHEQIQESTTKYHTLNKKLEALSRTNTKNVNSAKQQFFPSTVNNTDFTFNPDEMSLLNKGLKYNLNFKHKSWIENLGLEAETAVALLPITEQDHVRHLIAHNLGRLYGRHSDNQSFNTAKAIREKRTIQNIKTKLSANKAIITKAGKGNSLIIMYEGDYDSKIHNFIKDNNFNTSAIDPTKTFQTLIRLQNPNC
jgi:hypothetical protein